MNGQEIDDRQVEAAAEVQGAAAQPLPAVRPARARYMRKFGLCRICFRELAPARRAPGRDEVELVGGDERMNMTDPIADMLTRIRNAHRPRGITSRRHAALEDEGEHRQVLKDEGFIQRLRGGARRQRSSAIRVHLRYTEARAAGDDGTQARQQAGAARLRRKRGDIPRVLGGLGIAILSTPHGVMTGARARARASAARSSATSGNMV